MRCLNGIDFPYKLAIMFSSLSPCPWDAVFQQLKDVRNSKRAGAMGSCGKLENVAGEPLSFSLGVLTQLWPE